MKVALFCGGRGSASIIAALLERDDVELSLLINAYDDGRSTGVLRRLLPGLPGPADFRKNLALLLSACPGPATPLAAILEHRLRDGDELAGWARWFRSGGTPPVEVAFGALNGVSLELAQDLDTVRDELGSVEADALSDCALGNLVIAGRWLREGRDFAGALERLLALVPSRARLVDVDSGGCRYLVGLKQDGELLESEAGIVAPQSTVPIEELFLLEWPLAAAEKRELLRLGPEERREALRSLHRPAHISTEAAAALEAAEVIIYGPGTQFSSLLPSYSVRGVPEAITRGDARARVLVVNLRHDHDIAGLTAQDVLSRALGAFGDPDDTHGLVSHVLYGMCPAGLRRGVPHGSAAWIEAPLESVDRPGEHDGRRVAELVFDVARSRAPGG